MRLSAARFLAVVALLAPGAARAQQVHLRGDDRTRAAQIAREVLERNNFIRIARDTVLPESFHATGDLVVVDADVRLEGQVDGTAVVLGGDLYLRPGARVAGPIAVIDGGAYPSGKATYGPIFESMASTRVAVTAGADSTLVAEVTPPEGPGVFSFGPRPLPSYDRVNGLTLAAGASANILRRENGPLLSAWGGYRFQNEDHLAGGAALDVPLAGGVRALAEASRATRTNDAWARGDLGNSLAAVLAGVDYRDYYDADRVSLTLNRPLRKPLVAGESWLGARVGLQVEDARSLPTQDPWSLFGELDRPNPVIDDGQINSLIAGAELHWVGRLSRFALDAQVERGHPLEAPEDFTQLVGFGSYQATAFRTHTLRYRARVMLPVAGDAPQQRYGILGGVPTLPTLEIGELRGDHLVYTEESYAVPFPRLTLPFIGVPSLELRHAVGAAWAGSEDAHWVQNVGAGIVFPLVGVRVAVDPADTDRTRVFVVVSMPMM